MKFLNVSLFVVFTAISIISGDSDDWFYRAACSGRPSGDMLINHMVSCMVKVATTEEMQLNKDCYRKLFGGEMPMDIEGTKKDICDAKAKENMEKV